MGRHGQSSAAFCETEQNYFRNGRREAVAGRVEVPVKASCQNINTPEAKESQRQTVRSHGYTGRYVFNADKL